MLLHSAAVSAIALYMKPTGTRADKEASLLEFVSDNTRYTDHAITPNGFTKCRPSTLRALRDTNATNARDIVLISPRLSNASGTRTSCHACMSRATCAPAVSRHTGWNISPIAGLTTRWHKSILIRFKRQPSIITIFYQSGK